MKDELTRLLRVKTVVTFTVIGVFAYLALTGALRSEDVMLVVTTVVAFYFGTQAEKK